MRVRSRPASFSKLNLTPLPRSKIMKLKNRILLWTVAAVPFTALVLAAALSPKARRINRRKPPNPKSSRGANTSSLSVIATPVIRH